MIHKPRANALLSATSASPKPGDYPLGSTQSRAAARALADRLSASGEVLRIIVRHLGSQEPDKEIVMPPTGDVTAENIEEDVQIAMPHAA